jgi:hypothetical protein
VKLDTLAKHGRYKQSILEDARRKLRQPYDEDDEYPNGCENFEFLNELTKEQRSDLSKAVRDMISRGRMLLAVERYKKGEASLGRAAEIAGVPVGADDDDLDRVRGGEQDRR